ncbi:MAG: geranylgeranylglycerol-phosphate geranylgeranyltransferase [Candidatus Eisenbacteria bacterium]
MKALPSRIGGVLRVIRFTNSLTAAVATFLGGLLAVDLGIAFRSPSAWELTPSSGKLSRSLTAADPEALRSMLLASSCVFFAAAFGYALNDYYDVRSDEINRLSRPIPSGQMSKHMAVLVALVCLGLALVLALQLPPMTQPLAILSLSLVWLYSLRVKRLPVAGNVLVALLAALTLIFGGLAVGRPGPVLFPALLAFFVHLPREILKDVQDLPGDLSTGGRSIAGVVGPRTVARLAAALCVGLAGLGFVPYALGLYSRLYLPGIIVVDFILLWTAATVWNSTSEERVRFAVRLLKLAMLCGLVTIAAGSV